MVVVPSIWRKLIRELDILAPGSIRAVEAQYVQYIDHTYPSINTLIITMYSTSQVRPNVYTNENSFSEDVQAIVLTPAAFTFNTATLFPTDILSCPFSNIFWDS
jgi:hypothetical protein